MNCPKCDSPMHHSSIGLNVCLKCGYTESPDQPISFSKNIPDKPNNIRPPEYKDVELNKKPNEQSSTLNHKSKNFESNSTEPQTHKEKVIGANYSIKDNGLKDYDFNEETVVQDDKVAQNLDQSEITVPAKLHESNIDQQTDNANIDPYLEQSLKELYKKSHKKTKVRKSINIKKEKIVIIFNELMKNKKRRIIVFSCLSIILLFCLSGGILAYLDNQTNKSLNLAKSQNLQGKFDDAGNTLKKAKDGIAFPGTKKAIDKEIANNKRWQQYYKWQQQAEELMNDRQWAAALELLYRIKPDYPLYSETKKYIAVAESGGDPEIISTIAAQENQDPVVIGMTNTKLPSSDGGTKTIGSPITTPKPIATTPFPTATKAPTPTTAPPATPTATTRPTATTKPPTPSPSPILWIRGVSPLSTSIYVYHIDSGRVNLTSAIQICNNLGGRLPIREELKNIYYSKSSYGRFNPSNYWSEKIANLNAAYVVNFSSGDELLKLAYETNYVRCVK